MESNLEEKRKIDEKATENWEQTNNSIAISIVGINEKGEKYTFRRARMVKYLKSYKFDLWLDFVLEMFRSKQVANYEVVKPIPKLSNFDRMLKHMDMEEESVFEEKIREEILSILKKSDMNKDEYGITKNANNRLHILLESLK